MADRDPGDFDAIVVGAGFFRAGGRSRPRHHQRTSPPWTAEADISTALC